MSLAASPSQLVCCALCSPGDDERPFQPCLLLQARRRVVKALVLGTRAWEVDKSGELGAEVVFYTRPIPVTSRNKEITSTLLVEVGATVYEGHVEEGGWAPCYCMSDRILGEIEEAEAAEESDEDEDDDDDEDRPRQKRKKRRRPRMVPGPDENGWSCASPMVWLGFVTSVSEPRKNMLLPERLSFLFHRMTRNQYCAWNEEVGYLWDMERTEQSLEHLKPEDRLLYRAMHKLTLERRPVLPPKRVLLYLGVSELPKSQSLVDEVAELVPDKKAEVGDSIHTWLRWNTLEGVERWSFYSWILCQDIAFATRVMDLLRVCAGESDQAESADFDQVSDLVRGLESMSIRPGVWRVTNEDAHPKARKFLEELSVIVHTGPPINVEVLLVRRGERPALGAAELDLWREMCLSRGRNDVRVLPNAWAVGDMVGEFMEEIAKLPHGAFIIVSTQPSITTYLHSKMEARGFKLRVQEAGTCNVASLRNVQFVVVAGAHARGSARVVQSILKMRRETAADRAKEKNGTYVLGDQFLSAPLSNTAWSAWCYAVAPDAKVPAVDDLPRPTRAPITKESYAENPHAGTRWVGDMPFFMEDKCTVVHSRSRWLRYAMALLQPVHVTYAGRTEEDE